MPEPVGLVIFDCDGVLVDSERLSHEVLITMLREHGVEIAFDDAVRQFLGNSLAALLATVTQWVGRAYVDKFPGDFADEFAAAFERRTNAVFATDLRAVDGVQAVLDGLDERGVPYCVASNGPHSKMDVTLHHTALMSRLAGRIFSAQDVVHPKPAPDLFLLAAERMGVPPARCVVVEDSSTGVKAARAAGMRALGHCALTPADRLLAAGAHAVFHQMRELPALLGLAPVR